MGPLSLFTLAPGLPAPWEVVDVAFDPQSGRIDFHRAFAPGTRLNCFQFQACIHAKVSRVRCETCAKDAVRRQEVKRAPERRRTRCIWLQDKHAWRIQETLRELFQQRSERGAGQAAPRQIVQLGAPLPLGADQGGGQDA